MKVSISKIWNELNRTNFLLSWKKKCTYLAIPGDFLLNQQKNKTYDLKCKNSNNNNLFVKAKIIVLTCSILNNFIVINRTT